MLCINTFFFTIFFTHTSQNYMFTNHINLKFSNYLNTHTHTHTHKIQKLAKWSFQRLEIGWRDCGELKRHTGILGPLKQWPRVEPHAAITGRDKNRWI
jgi:hypothetical protein